MSEHKYNQTQSILLGGILNTVNLTTLGQGFGGQFRVGDFVTGSSLEVRGVWQMPLVADPLNLHNVLFRFIGFIWKDDFGPTSSDILEDQAIAPIGLTHSALRPLNHAKKVKRKLLWDYMWAGRQATNNANTNIQTASNDTGTFKFCINLSKYARGKLNQIAFQPGGTTLGTNNIYTFFMTNEGATQPNVSVLNLYTRYNFIDA